MKISSFFQDVLGANLANIQWSWGAFNPQTNQLFLRVWEDEVKTIDGRECSLLIHRDWSSKSLGHPERLRHIEAMRNGATAYGVACYPTALDRSIKRKIKGFDQDVLLQFGDVIEKGKSVFAEVLDRVPVEQVSRPKTAESSVIPDLQSILRKKIDQTEKETLAYARVGQGRFRDEVLRKWDWKCCVTGVETRDAIRASHIKPWKDSTNEEKLDPDNGLPLVATLDALFDRGLISFSPTGNLLASKSLNSDERKLLGISKRRMLRKPGKASANYLKYHREHIFEDSRNVG
jgi:putative restriction endonuclease